MFLYSCNVAVVPTKLLVTLALWLCKNAEFTHTFTLYAIDNGMNFVRLSFNIHSTLDRFWMDIRAVSVLDSENTYLATTIGSKGNKKGIYPLIENDNIK